MSVIYPEFFRAPCRKNYVLDPKRLKPFMMGTTSSITMQSLGRSINARRLWVGKYSVSNTVTLRVRRAVRSRGHYLNKYCVTVYGSIFIFFQKGLPSRYTRQFPFPLPGGATISAKFRSKIAKSPKIDGKVCAHHFRLRFE